MNLKHYVTTKEDAPKVLKRPFYFLDTTGVRWAAACDEKALVLIKAKVRLPEYNGEGSDLLAAWAAAEPTEPQKVAIAELLDWAGSADGVERKGITQGVQIDRSRLAKLLQDLTGDVTIWDASELTKMPCLGMLAKSGIWKALLAGYDEHDKDVPTFTGTPTGTELFDLAMDL